MFKLTLSAALLASAFCTSVAHAAWAPEKPVEFIVTAALGYIAVRCAIHD